MCSAPKCFTCPVLSSSDPTSPGMGQASKHENVEPVFNTSLQTSSPLRDHMDRSGYALVDRVLEGDECESLLREFEPLSTTITRRRAGVRDLFSRSRVARRLARDPRIRAIVEDILSPDAFAVRAILFDKTTEANWQVAWHQDRTIAVDRRAVIEGFGPWSTKANITHVQPPAVILERMVSLRLHLDSCSERKGALRVIAGSHRSGITSNPPTARAAHCCVVPRGGAVVMRPLIWHASSKASETGHRRVVHIEFTDAALPEPLDWRERW